MNEPVVVLLLTGILIIILAFSYATYKVYGDIEKRLNNIEDMGEKNSERTSTKSKQAENGDSKTS